VRGARDPSANRQIRSQPTPIPARPPAPFASPLVLPALEEGTVEGATELRKRRQVGSGSWLNDTVVILLPLDALEVTGDAGQAPVDQLDSGPLTGATLTQVDLRDADLTSAWLNRTIMVDAKLEGASLRGADLSGAVLTSPRPGSERSTPWAPNLHAATLRWADLFPADFLRTNMRMVTADGVKARRASFRGADFFYASFVQADLLGAELSDAQVYGVSAWDVRLGRAIQERLVITQASEPTVVVDDFQAAQFLHLLMTNSASAGSSTPGNEGRTGAGPLHPEQEGGAALGGRRAPRPWVRPRPIRLRTTGEPRFHRDDDHPGPPVTVHRWSDLMDRMSASSIADRMTSS
jgi:hypothetical protein